MENLIGKVKGCLDLINRKVSAQKSEDLGTRFKKTKNTSCILSIHVLGVCFAYISDCNGCVPALDFYSLQSCGGVD